MALMEHYFRVTGIKFDTQRSLIENVLATPTSFDQSLFFPQEIFTRHDVIIKIKSGDVFFINSEKKKIFIQLFSVDGRSFLKTSNKPLQKDFIEFIPEITQT